MMMISPGCFRRCNLGASTAASETMEGGESERESRESRGLLCIAGGISPETRVYVVAREKSRTKWGSL
jgi:hypothetical protein